MAKDDKIDRMASYIQVLLVHLLKQAVEQRTTKSWQAPYATPSIISAARTNAVRLVAGISQRPN